MQMSRETKFGYGFLLIGWAGPYLLERMFGANVAMVTAIVCTVVGGWLLFTGHLHGDEKSERPWNLPRVGKALATVGLLFAVGWTVWHFAHKRIHDENPVANAAKEPSPPIQPPAQAPDKRPIHPTAKATARKQQPDKPPPIPQAELQFSFFTVNPTEFPILETKAPLIDGAVTIEVTALNRGPVPAKNGFLIITICSGCRFAEEPENMVPSPDAITRPIVRERPFQEIYAGTIAVSMLLKIIPPPFYDSFLIAGNYACEGCPPVDPAKQQELKVSIAKRLP